jgi:hypothetical protein
MKTCTINMAQVKEFDNFKEQWAKMRECTEEEKEKVYKILSEIKNGKNN